MKTPDITSTIVAAAIGALVLVAIEHTANEQKLSNSEAVGYGALVGAIVQIGVRLTGVS